METISTRFYCFYLLFLLSLLTSCQSEQPFSNAVLEQLPETVDFNHHIRPILSDRCYKCHGPDEKARESDLRLDLEEGAFQKLDNGHYAIVPGNLSRSTLFKRIISKESDFLMPPPESKLSLSEKEKTLIGRWIEQGAEWKEHWSFITPQAVVPPKVEMKEWVSNPIDNFILKQLEANDLKPSPRAKKEILLRRLSLDLTGVAPTPLELKNFLEDKTPNAYEKAVDAFLDSPHYGERMAADWMDIARYADTHGYLDDTHREAWHWRDWVIKAFNKNLPYDDFITWQTAGDLLPNTSKEQRLATGFQRMHRQNQEGGVLPEEYRIEYVNDRVATTAKAFMGLTMECAQCHDHKFDPISQKDFYEMSAFFNSTFELGRAPIGYESGPTMLLSNDDLDKKLEDLEGKIQELEAQIAEAEKLALEKYLQNIPNSKTNNLQKDLQKGLIAHYNFDKVINDKIINQAQSKFHGFILNQNEGLLQEGKKGNAVLFNDDNAAVFGREVAPFDRQDPFSITLWTWLPEVYDDASIFDKCDHKWHAYRGFEMRIANGKLHFRLSHNYPQNALVIESKEEIPIKEWINLGITYDGSSQAKGLHLYLNGKELQTKIIHDDLYKSILHDDENPLVVMPYFGFKVGWRFNDPTLLNGKIDELRIYDRQLSNHEIAFLNQDKSSVIQATNDELFQHKWLHELHTNNIYRELYTTRSKQNEIITKIPEVMTMGDTEKPRPTFILNRGLYNEPGDSVEHDTPERIFPFNKDYPKNRLGLAKWLVDRKNPLTARVAVNRLWKQCFGVGLVKTPGDFGSQGALPSHPELLDWLAIQFMDSGWDIKALLKLIMTSATYQQSSKITETLEAIDPNNELLARGPRYRLSAEMIRDQALKASGLIVEDIGGESFKPYQPEGLWKEKAFQAWANYEEDTDENLYRRSLYIYWKRNTPHPYLTTFDIPDRAVCTVNRITTSTPTQALMLLNYPQFTEAARALGEKAYSLNDSSLDEKLQFIYESLTCQRPENDVLELMRNLYQEELSKFSEDIDSTRDYLTVGRYKIGDDINEEEVATLGVVAHSIMNTVEFYMKK